jgi:hypothetical protein
MPQRGVGGRLQRLSKPPYHVGVFVRKGRVGLSNLDGLL